MIDAHKIVYNNLSSEEFDVTLHCSFDNDNGAVSSFLSREGVYTEHYDGHRIIHRAKNNEVLTPRFTLIKKDYGDFDSVENRRMLSWLTSSDKPGWFEIYKDDSNVIEWRIFGYVSQVEQYKLGNGRVVGYEFEVESSHPYAWSRKFIYPEVHSTTAEINNNDETNDYLQVNGTSFFTIPCNTDEYNKPLYPKVIIDFNGENVYFPVNGEIEKDKMIPDVVYAIMKNGNVSKYSVNISTEKIQYDIKVVQSDEVASGDKLQNNPTNRFYDSDAHIIKKIVGKGTTEEPYVWETVVKVGAAVKIDTVYTYNEETISKEIIVKGVAPGETIILDGTNKVISVTPNDDTKIIGENFNWEWLPLAYGDNKITISGNCAVQIQWIEPRKVGSL